MTGINVVMVMVVTFSLLLAAASFGVWARYQS